MKSQLLMVNFSYLRSVDTSVSDFEVLVPSDCNVGLWRSCYERDDRKLLSSAVFPALSLGAV